MMRRTPEDQLADQLAGSLLNSPRGRQLLLIGLILFAIIYAAVWLYHRVPHRRFPVGPTVRLATWNLREFSEHRRAVDLDAISNVITGNHFDLVAIQEVKLDGGEVNRLVDRLGYPWRAARYSDITGNHERFAFIYNADHVQEVAAPHFIATTAAVTFDRTPYQDTFKAGSFTFTLIEVHLTYTNVERRSQEMQTLETFAAAMAARSTTDTIVCGDFNEEPPHENLHYFLDAGWESLNHDPTNLGGTEVFDTFLIDPSQTHEWTGTAGSVHWDETMYAGDRRKQVEEVSDHRPAYADFVTAPPGVTPAKP